MVILRKHKDAVKGCLDCHKTYQSLQEYPCVIYKVCPLNVPGRFYIGSRNGNKNIRACLLIGKDCNCA